MRLCPTCGRQYEDGTIFCLDDGSALDTVMPQQQAFEPGPYSPTPQPQKKSYGIIIGVVVVILLGMGAVLAAGLVGAYFYFQSGSSEIASDSPSPTPTLPPFGSDFPSPTPTATKSPTPTPSPSPSVTPTATPKDPDDDLPEDDGMPPSTLKTIAGGILNSKATSLPKPPYPPAARAVRAEGMVVVSVTVDEDGNVEKANAMNGHPLLRQAAEQAARGAKFKPEKLSGQPVKVSGILNYNFTL